MRHLRSGRKLNRSASHRRAMYANLATSLFDKERIVTTKIKAKEIRPFVERLITYGKKGSLHAIRLAGRVIRDKNILHKLFHDIAPGYKEREGGYTRILTLRDRAGDNAEMALIELGGRKDEAQRAHKKKKMSGSVKAHPQPAVSAAESTVGAPVQSTESVQQEAVAQKEPSTSEKI